MDFVIDFGLLFLAGKWSVGLLSIVNISQLFNVTR